jgi:hypothetical protein
MALKLQDVKWNGKMTKATIPLKLSEGLMCEATRLAKRDGISFDQWIGYAVAQKIGAAQMAAYFFRELAKGASVEDLKRGLGWAAYWQVVPIDEPVAE